MAEPTMTFYPHGFAHELRRRMEEHRGEHIVVSRGTLESIAIILDSLPRLHQVPFQAGHGTVLSEQHAASGLRAGSPADAATNTDSREPAGRGQKA